MLAGTTLLGYWPTYRLRRPLRREYFHRHSLDVFVRWLGRDPVLWEMDDAMLSRFVEAMAARYAPRTVLRLRANVLSTVRQAAREGLTSWPMNVRPVRVPASLPEAWTIGQVRQLLATCHQVPHGRWLAAFIRLVWDTGLRTSDATALTWSDVDRGYVMQGKVQRPVMIRVRPETVEALRQLPGDRPLAYGSRRQRYQWWRALCQAASVPHGGPQRLRRSAATYVELEQPGAATAFLGHRSADLARRHYIDPRILGHQPAQPPPL